MPTVRCLHMPELYQGAGSSAAELCAKEREMLGNILAHRFLPTPSIGSISMSFDYVCLAATIRLGPAWKHAVVAEISQFLCRHPHLCTHANAHTQAHARTQAHTRTRAHVHTHAHIHTCTRTRARARSYIHTHTRTCTHTRAHVHTLTHTRGEFIQ